MLSFIRISDRVIVFFKPRRVVTVEPSTATVCCTNVKCLLSKSVGIKQSWRPIHYHDRDTFKLGPILLSAEVFHVRGAVAFLIL
jgi:hypothetical protein